MKKFLTLSFSTIIIAVIAIVFCLYNSSIQTKIINSISPEFSVRKVSITPSKAIVEDAKIGKLVSIKRIDANYSLWDIPFKKIIISSLIIDDVNIDTRANKQSKKTEKQTSTQREQSSAKSTKINIPWIFELRKLKANISIDGEKFDATAKQIYIAENLKPKSGLIEISSKEASLKISTESEKNSIILKSLMEANGKKILQASATSPFDFSEIALRARVDADNKILSKILPSLVNLPNFSTALYAEGKIWGDFSNLKIKIIGDAKASNLSKLSPSLTPIGECELNLKLDIEKAGDKIDLHNLDANLLESGTPIAHITAAPFSAKNASELEKAEITTTISIPVRILEAFAPDFKISGNNICAKISAKKINDKIELVTLSPISFVRAGFSKNGENIINDINIFADAQASIAQESTANINLFTVDSKNEKAELNTQITIKNGKTKIEVVGNGDLNPIVSRINSVASISSLGLKFALSGNADIDNGKTTLNNLTFNAKTSDGKNAITLKTKSKIFVDANGLKSESPEILSVDAPIIPFSLIKPFLPELDVETGAFSAEISSHKNAEYDADFSISVKSLNYKKDNEYVVRNLSFSTMGKAYYNEKNATVKILKGMIAENASEFGTFDANVNYNIEKKSLEEAEINLTTSLPNILAQPIIAKYSNISRGSADVFAKYESNKLDAKITVHGLSALAANGAIDVLKADLKTDFTSFNLSCDINSTRGESKITASLKNNKNSLDINVNSSSLVIEDLQTLSKAFGSKSPTTKSTSEKGKSQKINKPSLDVLKEDKTRADSIAKRDEKAFWDFEKNLSLRADIGSLISNNSPFLKDLKLRINSTSTRLDVSEFSCSPYGAHLTGATSITFDSQAKIPYKLTPSKISVESFEVSELFADKDNPTLSGVFDATVSVSGVGNNAEHLANYLTGNAVLKSRKGGTLRLLNKNEIAGKSASILGGIFKITGKILDGKVKELDALSEVISILSYTEYQNAEIRLSRNDVDYNYNIDFAEIKTDTIRLNSESGKIFFDPYAKSFGEQKLHLPIKTSVSSGAKVLFEKIGYGRPESSQNKGYFTGPTFNIEGTVSNPKNNLLNVLNGAKGTVNNIINNINFFK